MNALKSSVRAVCVKPLRMRTAGYGGEGGGGGEESLVLSGNKKGTFQLRQRKDCDSGNWDFEIWVFEQGWCAACSSTQAGRSVHRLRV